MIRKVLLGAVLVGAMVSLASVGGGCTTGGASSGTATEAVAATSCDPLTVAAPPIALGEVIAAGRSADGTVYVLDRGPVGVGTDFRAFISEGSALRRWNVAGSGETPDFITVTLGDPSPDALQLRVDLAGGKATRMGVFRGPPDPKTKSFEIGVQGEELALVPAAELSRFTLVNVAGMRVDYDATTTDGHRLVVLSPTIDRTDDEVRVFYGTDDRLLERRVFGVTRSSSMRIGFDLDGTLTVAVLEFGLGPSGSAPRLEAPEGGEQVPLTPVPGSPGDDWATRSSPDGGADGGASSSPPRLSSEALVAGLHFYCF